MSALPKLPNEGTDNDRLLVALQGSYPRPLWNASSKLQLTAHSRVCELRNTYGWEIETVRRQSPSGVKKGKQQYGYLIQTPRAAWPAGDAARGRVVA